MRRFMDVVDELVEMPIVKTHPLYPGYSPLMCAVYGGSLDATHFLIREGAKVRYGNNTSSSDTVQKQLGLFQTGFCLAVSSIDIISIALNRFKLSSNFFSDECTCFKLCLKLARSLKEVHRLLKGVQRVLRDSCKILQHNPFLNDSGLNEPPKG